MFHTKPFSAAEHRVQGAERYQTAVDGRLAIGTDGNVPHVEITAIEFSYDGKAIPVGRWMYADLFEPHFTPDAFSVRATRGGGGVVARMSGSDGAGGYEVVWRFVAQGRHRRFVQQGL